jgi:hypothetical protein
MFSFTQMSAASWVQQPVVARTAARDSAAKSYGNFLKTSAYSTGS